MSANELAEALQAQIWLACPPTNDDNDVLSVPGIRIRSQNGFQNRIIASEDVTEYPLLILPLERELVRSDTAIVVSRVSTVSDTEGANQGTTYPGITTPAADYSIPAPLVQAIHLDWMGPDLTAPVWYPFQTATPIGSTFDRDVYNAIAILLTADDPGEEGLVAIPGDVIVTIRKCPRAPDGIARVFDNIIPLPA